MILIKWVFSNDENYGHTSYGAISAFGENYLLRDDIDQVSFQ